MKVRPVFIPAFWVFISMYINKKKSQVKLQLPIPSLQKLRLSLQSMKIACSSHTELRPWRNRFKDEKSSKGECLDDRDYR